LYPQEVLPSKERSWLIYKRNGSPNQSLQWLFGATAKVPKQKWIDAFFDKPIKSGKLYVRLVIEKFMAQEKRILSMKIFR
jgi:hypothetical protein